MTALEFYNKLKEDLPFLKSERRINNIEIELNDQQINMLNSLFHLWKERVPENLQRELIVDVLQEPDNENGKVYEALVYAWLEKHQVRYKPQVHIEQKQCLKKSKNGYEADGMIEENKIIFDVKQFGLTIPHIMTLKRKLQEKVPTGYLLTIEGGRHMSSKELQRDFLEKIDETISLILDENNKNHTDYIYYDSKHGMEFRLWDLKNSSTCITISEFDIYRWAQNNEFYFMYHASQFCTDLPYIIFCPYDKTLMPIFSDEDTTFKFAAFRTLCRRVFMHLPRIDDRMISEYDGKAQCNVSVACAAKKISAIVFLDVSDEFDYNNCQMFVFQNPNADYKIPRYKINSLFRYAGAWIEDFEYDNY